MLQRNELFVRIAPWIIAGVLLLGTIPALGSDARGEGSWESANSELIEGSWTLNVTMLDGEIRGTLELGGSPTMSRSQVEGRIEADTIVFGTVSRDGDSVSFEGVRDGSSVSGTWGSASLIDNGTWTGTLTTSAASR